MNRTIGLIAILFITGLGTRAAHSLKLPISAHNHLVKFTATATRIEANYGDYTPDEGRRILVFETTWENIVDPALAEKRNLPDRAINDDFRASVQLVIDGRETVPALVQEASTANLDPEDPDLMGHTGGSTGSAYIRSYTGIKNAARKRALAYLALEKPGDRVSGDLLFAIPTRDWQSLELIYRDPLGGDFRVLLDGVVPVVLEPVNVQTNEVFALSAVLTADPAQREPAAPAGRRYVTVDFQVKSLLKVQDIYPPYDPAHEPETLRWRADPARWLEYRTALELIADGVRPCGLDPASDVPETGMFSPETWTRHQLIFLVPAKTKSLDLVCRFATYQIPGIDHDVTPKPIRFHLTGPVASGPGVPAAPEVKILDDKLELMVTHHAVTAQIADVTAGPGEKFVVVDFFLRNTGTAIESFKVPEQLVWFGADGQTPPDELSARGPSSAPPSFGLGPSEARTFQVIWRVPAKLRSAEFGLKGNVVAEKFTLQLGSP